MRAEELCVASTVRVFLSMTTRWQSYIVGVVDERGDLLHIEPVHVLLEKPKQGQVQSGQSGLLTLEQGDPNDPVRTNRRLRNTEVIHTVTGPVGKRGSHL